MRPIRLLLACLRVSLQNEMAYRADWFARSAQTLMSLATTLGTVWIIFSHTNALAGWRRAEVACLVGVYYIVQGPVSMILAPNMRTILEDIRRGTLDFLILKPVCAQYFASIRKISLWGVFDVAVGIAVCGVSLYHVHGTLPTRHILQFALLLACGLIVLYSVWLALVTTTFWFVKIMNIEEIVWQATEAGRYPIDVYPRWLRFGLSYIIPVGLVITYPSRSLLNRTDASQIATAVLLAAGTFTAASLLWRRGLRHYSGASA